MHEALPGSSSFWPPPASAMLTRTAALFRCHDGEMFRAPQVNFYVEDIDASVRFYRDLLGFAETFRTPRQGRPVHVELRCDGFTLGLATIESLRDVHGVTAGTGPPRAEVVLWTDDVDAACQYAAGCATPGVAESAGLYVSHRSVAGARGLSDQIKRYHGARRKKPPPFGSKDLFSRTSVVFRLAVRGIRFAGMPGT